MTNKHLRRGLAAAMAFAFIAVSCGGDDSGSTATEAPTVSEAPTASDAPVASEAPATDAPAAEVDYEAAGLWNDGPCDASLDPLVVGIQAPGETATLTLIDQGWALESSAEAFNARGGANGHCIKAVYCDDQADPNQAVACVKSQDEAGVVVTVNDTTPVGDADTSAGYAAASIPRFAISPGSPDFKDTNSYPMTAGGLGTTFMMAEALRVAGKSKIAIIRVDTPSGSTLKGLLETIFGSKGLTFVADLPVPAGTTDYSQFVIAAQDAGAEAIMMPLGGQESIQVVNAAKQLGVDLLISGSMGTFPLSDIRELGDFGANLVLNEGIIQVYEDNPVTNIARADLALTGHEELTGANIKASPFRSWIGLYALLYMIREAGLTEFTKDTLRSTIEASGEIPMLGLTRDWTPKTDHPGAFPRIGNGQYYFFQFDPTSVGFDGEPIFKVIGEGDMDEVLCGTFGGPCA